MVIDRDGRAYVGNLGFDIFAGEAPGLGKIFLIEPDGSFRVVAEGLALPNGAVITPDGRHFVVAESFAGKLTRFDRAANGDLSNPRCYAELPERIPDGICLDVDGNIWVAEFGAGQFSLIDTRGELVAVADDDQGDVAIDGREQFIERSDKWFGRETFATDKAVVPEYFRPQKSEARVEHR